MALQSRLEIEVDARSSEQKVSSLRKALEELYQAGERASAISLGGSGLQGAADNLAKVTRATEGLSSANKEASDSNKKLAETADQAMARLTKLGQAAVDQVKARQNLASAAVGLSEAEQGLLSGQMVLSARQPRIKAATDSQTESTKKATVSIKDQQAELRSLLESIDPATRALNRLDEQERKLGQKKTQGLVDSETFSTYQGKIDAARQELGRLDTQLGKTGVSAKQNAAALRMLPAQFSDIVVSLQGGQAPLTVLLQQGSQIKDSFGGVGNAFKQTASYALGMINPLTLAAAAMAVLLLAYKQGSDEATAYNTALAMTGNTAGVTSGQLGDMAARIAASGGTIGKAASTLALLASSTKIPASSFESLTKTINAYEKATGQAATETVANFEKIAKDPSAAILTLNESMNFLTASTYSQIKALQDQGDTAGAAQVANEAYQAGLDRTSSAIQTNLGALERTWNSLAGAAKGAWDAILNIGREQTLDQQIAELDKQLTALANSADGGKRNSSVIAGRFGSLYPDKTASADVLTAKRANLLILKSEKDRRAESQGLAQQVQQQSLADQILLDKTLDRVASNETKRTKELDAFKALVARRQVEAAKKNDKSLLISAEQQAKVIADIENKYKDPKTPKTPAVRDNAGQSMLSEARQRYAVLQQQTQVINGQVEDTQKLGTEAKKLIELEAQIADLKSRKTLTTSQKQVLAMADLNLAQQRQNAELEKSNQLTQTRLENEAKLKAFSESLADQLALSREAMSNELSGAGMGDLGRSRMQQQLKIQQDYQKQLQKLTRDYNNKSNPTSADTDLYNAETTKLKEALATQLEDQKKHYADLDALRANWLTGVGDSLQNYVDMSRDYNTQAKDATASILGDSTNSISQSIQGLAKGTETLGGAFVSLGQTMAGSVLTAISDIIAKTLVSQALQLAGIQAVTTQTVASEGVKATAKVAADGVTTASSLASIGSVMAASVSAAVTTLASWAPAALVASIGSFGAAAVVGGAGLLAAFALIKGISGGFSEGGYTGAGGKYEPAGIVHKGEVVWSQADISRYGGVAAVESLRTGNVTPITAQSGGSSKGGFSSSGQISQNINIYNNNGSQVETRQKPNGDRDIIINAAVEEVANQLASGYGPVNDAGSAAYGWRRSGS